jgi:pilus assembly protein CpaB
VSEDDSVLISVPSRALARGEQLSGVAFERVKWPKTKLSGGYIVDIAAYKEAYALSSIPALLPIPQSAVSTSPIDANAVVEAIPAGMRAITVKVDAESAVEGWARSGNSVDVILVRAARDPGVGLESLIIAENVKILSAGSSVVPVDSSKTAPKAPNTVTLLTSQEDALKIKTAANLGKLTFALRGAGDQLPAVATSVDQRRLLGAPPTAEPRREPFKGRAKGPDGKLYVLGRDAQWLKSAEESAAAQSSSPSVSSKPADARQK